MGRKQAGKAGTGTAIVGALATAATAATQVARIAKATETTAGVAQRARGRILENRRMALWLLLGVLGMGIILGLVMAKRAKRAGGSDEPAADLPEPTAVSMPEATESTTPTDSTEASG